MQIIRLPLLPETASAAAHLFLGGEASSSSRDRDRLNWRIICSPSFPLFRGLPAFGQHDKSA